MIEQLRELQAKLLQHHLSQLLSLVLEELLGWREDYKHSVIALPSLLLPSKKKTTDSGHIWCIFYSHLQQFIVYMKDHHRDFSESLLQQFNFRTPVARSKKAATNQVVQLSQKRKTSQHKPQQKVLYQRPIAPSNKRNKETQKMVKVGYHRPHHLGVNTNTPLVKMIKMWLRRNYQSQSHPLKAKRKSSVTRFWGAFRRYWCRARSSRR